MDVEVLSSMTSKELLVEPYRDTPVPKGAFLSVRWNKRVSAEDGP